MSATNSSLPAGDFRLITPNIGGDMPGAKKWVHTESDAIGGPPAPMPSRDTLEAVLRGVKNPKDAIAGNKIPMHLFPATAIVLGSLGLLEGREKYGESNFLATPVNASVYIAAALRHLYKLLSGIDNDEESGLPQEAHILACIAILVDAREAGTLVDDRRFNSTNLLPFMERMTPLVAQIKAKHAGKNPKHYTIADNATVEEK